MLLSPLKISPLSSGRGGSAPVHLNSSLNEWNYQNATDVGTTVTMVDTGSVGGLNTTNPDVPSEPTITANGIVTDGIAQYLKNDVVDFRNGDTTGVVHTYFYYNGSPIIVFAAYEDANNYILINIIASGYPQFIIKIGGVTYILRGSNALAVGFNRLAIAQNGTVARMFINGVKETSYSTDTTASGWFNLINTVSINFMHLPPSNYYASTLKWISYNTYTSDALVVTEQNELLQI